MSYMRSVYLHKDKSIFKVDELPAERFAASLGLPGAPKIKFLSKGAAKKRKNASYIEKNTRQEVAAAGESEGDGSRDGHSGDETSEAEPDDSEMEEQVHGTVPQEGEGKAKKKASAARYGTCYCL